ncbi:hypothetical protein H7B90_29325 [Cohnella xylanilytica]|uniref:BNR/Asp-box repeat protein n=1 Tax=Cohnella xylanilytica TaxID=557555 RepID=A0A841U6N1_9BACL|nr:hypothetical protein [Cohnella xylanilytica]MBB6695499.1 hypothetical protein [Cohnella xylanilytica]
MTVAMSLALSGCSGSGNTPAGSPQATDSGSASPSVSPSASPSASPSSSPAGSESPSASPSAEPSGGGASASPVGTGTKPSTEPAGTVTALRLADAKSGWAGGKGWIARTDDGGVHWTKQYTGSFTVNQLFALNGNKVWATLAEGKDAKTARLVRSTDGGKHWEAVGTVPNRAFLHFTDDKTAFSGNATTTDGGRTWKTLNVPKGVVGDVYFHDAANGWAVQASSDKYSFLHSADAGKTWKTVMTRKIQDGNGVTGTLIRSAGKNDAWIEVVGGSGMSQTSYALFHTTDGGKSWLPAIVNNTAGAGPAPGFSMDDDKYPKASGSKPGALYVVNPQTAFLGGECPACDKPNSIMETTDGGKSWAARKSEFDGFGEPYLAAADASHLWFVATDSEKPSVLYTSSDGGKSWKKAHTFAKSSSGT